MKRSPLNSPKATHPPSSSTTAAPNVTPTQPPATDTQSSRPRPPLSRRSETTSFEVHAHSPVSIARPSFANSATETETEESDVSGTDNPTDDEEGEGGGLMDGNQENSKGNGNGSAEGLEPSPYELLSRVLELQSRPRRVAATSPRSFGERRISPIQEEDAPTISPSVEASFSSPLPTGVQTTSTESTESARTIRGSVPPTPAHRQPHTPGYFPYVPTPGARLPSSQHQPFTGLSPTVSGALPSSESPTPRERVLSNTSTPSASHATFMPEGSQYGLEDPRWPTPNLYDLVLRLNSESGLEQWWTTVVKIMQDHFGAERASIAIPSNPQDIENLPWGQKATFNRSGPIPPKHHQAEQPFSQNRGLPSDDDDLTPFDDPTPTHDSSKPSEKPPERTERPRLESRHSFAGHEQQRKDALAEVRPPASPIRPHGPLRTVSHAPHMTTPLRQVVMPPSPFDGTPTPFPPRMPPRNTTFSDPDFSSVSGVEPSGPVLQVFPGFRALDTEHDALIDNSGITRVLERAKLVTLTRDYACSSSSIISYSSEHKGSFESDRSTKSCTEKKRTLHLPKHEQPIQRYEEYEQNPASSWTQSPAPSPAIQSDTSENPFFAATNVDEETFDPATSSGDYSRFENVEAIGVDRASTIIHIPLIHPIWSHTLPLLPSESEASTPAHHEYVKANNTPQRERRAPIAIVSILSPIVPFPHNLTQTLKYLAPHLATSFLTAQQFSDLHNRLSDPRRPPNLSLGHAGLGGLMGLDIDEAAYSAAGSMTSPSDYSGKSRHSPPGSVAGTPMYELATADIGFHSVGGTPAVGTGMEKAEGYFDAKRKPSSITKSGSSASLSQMQHAGRTSPSVEHAENLNVSKTPGLHREPSPSRGTPLAGATARRGGHRTVSSQDRRAHTMLHSYGATNPATPAARTPGPGHSRSNSMSEVQEMPDPSPTMRKIILDTLPVQAFTAAPGTGMITWANQNFMAYRGHEGHQIMSDPWIAIHPDDRQTYQNSWEKSLRTGQPFQQKVRVQRFDRMYRWFYIRVVPLKDKKQNIVHWLGTNMDIHEQHLAEVNAARQQETAASEAKYRALANSSPQIVFAVTKSKGLTFCNTQWVSYSGQTEEEARGLGFLDHVHPEDLIKCRLPAFNPEGNMATNVPTTVPIEPLESGSSTPGSSGSDSKTVTSPGNQSSSPSDLPQTKLSKLAETGILKVTKDIEGRPSYSTEVRLRSRDGTYRWHLVRTLLAEQAVNDDQEEETWYGTCTDINDHKLLEQTLKETMDAKSRFLSNMSHEIRTPLNGITGMVNFLMDSDLSEEQMEHVNIIRNSTEGLRDLINDILDISKVEAGMITLTFDWLHVRSLIEEVNDLTSAMAIGKGLELNYIVEEDVPIMIKGDRFRIRQVLLNVIGNAIKFTDRGEVFVHCHIEKQGSDKLEPNEIMLRFDVTDTGTGFTKKDAEFLFKRFSQIDGSSTRQRGGTGLGLAISMQLVELHGGRMSAESEPGKGSVFTFVVKCNVPSGADFPPRESPPSFLELIEESEGRRPASAPPRTTSAGSVPKKTPEVADSPGLRQRLIKSPVASPESIHYSPSVSSGSSDPSIRTAVTSIRSERSSASSFVPDPSLLKEPPITLSPPPTSRDSLSKASASSADTIKPTVTFPRKALSPLERPRIYSILVTCPLEHSRKALVHHIKAIIPQNVPTNITDEASLVECQRMLGDKENPTIFTHIVLNLTSSDEIIALIDQILSNEAHSATEILVISDFSQRREIIDMCTRHDLVQLEKERRVHFIFRPVKPSKLAVIFDPRKERELSTDRNQGSAQQVAETQKGLFAELRTRLCGKGLRILMVEDNSTNQAVLLRYMKKIKIEHCLVVDGVKCIEEIMSKPHGYYSIVLCDLEMPNKNGFDTCAEIRKWEIDNGYKHLPIIALSANVVGQVQDRCARAGFNSYCSKPFNFQQLGHILIKYLDPSDPSKPHEFMKPRSVSAPQSST